MKKKIVVSPNTSIHPRVWAGGDKSNTCKPPKDPSKGTLGKRTRKLQARRQAYDMGLSKTNPHEGRRPGSMTK